MKCKKCGYEWQTYGEHPLCPCCGNDASMSASEQHALWEEARNAERIKDARLRASCLLRLAEQGDRQAQFAYAECRRQGIGVQASLEDAVHWYKAAARKLFPAAAYQLSVCLQSEQFANNLSQVVFWLRVAAEFGVVEALYDLAHRYEAGDGIDQSHQHALYYLVRAANAGHQAACFELAKMYATGDGVRAYAPYARYYADKMTKPTIAQKLYLRKLAKVEAEEAPGVSLSSPEEERLYLGRKAEASGEQAIAANIYFLAAQAGNKRANYLLGCCYAAGNGVPQSDEEARRRFRLAAAHGDTDALYKLGHYAKNGLGGPADPAEALRCYTAAHEGGHTEATFELAEAYSKGTLSPVDLPRALALYDIAAKAGHEEAKKMAEDIRSAIAEVYNKGLTAKRAEDMEKAFHFFSVAARMGHPAANRLLGEMLQAGIACKQDLKRAAKCYRIAAEQNDIGAIYRLGVCYLYGLGLPYDYQIARQLLSITAKKNYGKSSELIAEMDERRRKKHAQKLYSYSTVFYRRGDVTDAIRLRTAAAKEGHAKAMYLLGCHFEFGDGGLPMDRVKANAWYARAAAAGYSGEGRDLKGAFLRERRQLLLRQRAKQ